MARYLGPRLRITRRLGHLSGLTRKKPTFKPLNPANPLGPRKIIPPGQHGRNKSFKKKPYESCEYDYLIRLKLKQRLRFHYGLTERQLVRYVQQAKKTKGSTGRVLLRLLEMRLDNIVFRLHMAPTIRAARQLISHGHILVNKTKVTIPSYQCEAKDVITVSPKIRSMELISRFLTEFEREKSRYQRLLQILEYGKRGVTLTKTDLYSTKKNSLKTDQNSIKQSARNTKIQSLKVGSVLNVQVKQQGRYEAEAISYAFGKMIVIHPLFIGKQSLNKRIRVIIYKKSQNNKILYAYPTNPFYLRLENIRQLNSLDVVRIFGRYTGRSFSRPGLKFFIQKKGNEKKNLSSLILMNAAKIFPKNFLKQRQSFNSLENDKKNSLINLNQASVKKESTNQSTKSVFVRIIATKCSNNKLQQNQLDLTSSNTDIKDPVAYREKFVYTKTNQILSPFGTRFYAQILKDQFSVKNFLSEQKNERLSKNQKELNVSENQINLSKTTVLGLTKNTDSKQNQTINLSKPKSKKVFSTSMSESKKLIEVTSKTIKDTNENVRVFQAGRGFPILIELLNKQNQNVHYDSNRILNLPLLVNQYIKLFSKLANLKQQKSFKSKIYSQLKIKLLRNLLVISKNQFLMNTDRNNFIFILFSKILKVFDLTQKNQFLQILSNNIEDLFFDKQLKQIDFNTLSLNKISLKTSEEIFFFILKVKSILMKSFETKINLESNLDINHINNASIQQHIELFRQNLKNNLHLLVLLDQIKNNLQNYTTFAKQFFSSEISIIQPNFSGINVDSMLLKTNKLISMLTTDIISKVKSFTIILKLLAFQSFCNESYKVDTSQKIDKIFQTIEKKLQSLRIYKKIINFFMLNLPKSFYISQYDSAVLKLEKLYTTNNINEIDFYERNSELLNNLSLGVINQQKIKLLITNEFLTKYSFLRPNNFNNVSDIIKSNLISHKVYQIFLQEVLLNSSKINELNNKLNLIKTQEHNDLLYGLLPTINDSMICKMEHTILEKQTQSFILLFSNLENKLTNQQKTLVNSVNTANIERKIFVKQLRNCLMQKKISQKLLNQKNCMIEELNLLQKLNLIKSENITKLKDFLDMKFSLLEKLVLFSFLPCCKKNIPTLNKVIEKISNQIVQTVASFVSFWKISFLKKQNKITVNEFDASKQIMIDNILTSQVKFIKKLMNKLLDVNKNSFSLNNLGGFIKNSVRQQSLITNKAIPFEFINQMYILSIIDSLKNSSILSIQSFIQISSNIREKLSIKKLMQTNLVLIKFLDSFKINSDIRFISLDNFIQNGIKNFAYKKMNFSNKWLENIKQENFRTSFSKSNSENLFWKKILFDFTPIKIKNALEYLKFNNFFSFIPSLNLKTELEILINLFKQNRNLKISSNKQYVTLKLQAIKNILAIFCENLNILLINNLSIFKTNVWGLNKMLGLELLQQSKLKLLERNLETQKLQLISKIQTLSFSKNYAIDSSNSKDFNSSIEALNFIISQIENQFSFILSKVLIDVTEDSTILITGRIFEKEKLLKNIKLYLLRYQFINQTLFINKKLAKIYLLRKQKSVLISRSQYQTLKNAWMNYVMYKNSNPIKILLQNKYPIISYLNKELRAKFDYKLLKLIETDILTKNEFYLLSNTLKRLTTNNLAIESAADWISLMQNSSLKNKNQEVLTQKIALNYSVQNIPVYYNLPTYNNSRIYSSLDCNIEKADWFKILTDLKYQLNSYKLQNLNSKGWINLTEKSFQLKAKTYINQTVDYLSLIENRILNSTVTKKDLDVDLDMKNLKSSTLNSFYNNVKRIIYFSKLHMLNERKLITEEQNTQFNQKSENLFQLVRQANTRIAVLNSRRKWKFINYRKYQTLSEGILKNLNVQIIELLSKNDRTSKEFNLPFSEKENLLSFKPSLAKICYLKNRIADNNNKSLLDQPTFIVQNFAQFQRQKNSKLESLIQTKQSVYMHDLIQQTLEQLLDSSEMIIFSLIHRFVEKSSRFTNKKLQNAVDLLNVTNIKELVKLTLQNLNSLQKQIKTKGPWLLKDEQTQKFKQIIFQNFVKNIQIINTECSNILSVERSLLSILDRNSVDFSIENLLNFKVLPSELFNNTNVFNKHLSNLEFQLQHLYKQKLIIQSNYLDQSNTNLKDFRVSILTKNNLLNYFQSNRIVLITNTLVTSNSSVSELNTIKLECELMLQNLTNLKISEKFNSELQQFSQLAKYQYNTLFSPKLYNQIKTTIINLLIESFIVIPFTKNDLNFSNNDFFNNSNNVSILSKFGIIPENMTNQIIEKLNAQKKNQQLQAILLYLTKLQKQFSIIDDSVSKENKVSNFLQSIYIISILSLLYELKQTNTLSERQYLSIKQKLKQLKLLSLLNTRLIQLKEIDKITDKNAKEFRQQIIQKIQQKIKKAKTLAKFKMYLKSVSEFTNNGQKKSNIKTKKTIASIIPYLNLRGRWAQVTLKQLSKQKLITIKQEAKFSKLLTQQTNIKVSKLRSLVRTLNSLKQFLENQNSLGFKTSVYEQQTLNLIINLLQSLKGPWKVLILKQLQKQELISQTLSEKLQKTYDVLNQTKQINNLNSTNENNFLSNTSLLLPNELKTQNFSIENKLKQLLKLYHRYILKLNSLQNNRSIRKTEYEQKLKVILSNVILLLENGGLKAFKIIYNTKWLTELSDFRIKNNIKIINKRSNVLSIGVIRDFSKKYEIFKANYLHSYQRLELQAKVILFNNYKVQIQNVLANKENVSILNVSRLENLKKLDLITLQQYLKLKVVLKTAIQRLTKLNEIFMTQNIYQVLRNSRIDRNTLSNTEIMLPVNTSVINEQYLQLQNKIVQYYLKFEYKQVEKNIIKQKFAQSQLNSFNLNKKANQLVKARLRKKQSIKQEQFASYFQQLVYSLDSKYKGEGRNRRGPRINNVFRQLNQKLAFDPILTKKFGAQLQMFIDKRFGPSLPIPPHLELKRWKIKKSVDKTTASSLRQENQKYLILPVGIVRDLAPRRSVGLPILERLIVEYYSRN